MMHILYVIHADFELPGVIEDWASEHRFSQSYVRPFAGEKLPNENSFDMLVIMGGPQSPLEIEKYPYLLDEIQLAKKACEAGKIVLGFCLGAQIIGEAYGAKTEHSPNKEIGVFPIFLTQEGREDPIFFGLPNVILVTHWHNDMPGMPREAKLLANSMGCPRQVIRFGEKVYGFQCHLEMKKENVTMILEHCPNDLEPGPFVQTKEDILSSDYESINVIMTAILDNLCSSTIPQMIQESEF